MKINCNISNGDEQKKAFYLKKAFDKFNLTIEIIEKIYHSETPFLAMIYNNIAKIYQAINDLENALKYYYLALNIRQKKLSTYNIRTFRTLQYISTIYKDQKKYDESLVKIQEAIEALVVNYKSKSLSNIPNFNNSYHLYDLLIALKLKALYLLDYYKINEKDKYLNASIKNYTGISQLIHKIRSSYNFESDKLHLAKASHEIFEKAIFANILKYNNTKNTNLLKQAFYLSEQSKASILFSEITEKSAQTNADISLSLLNKLSKSKLALSEINQQVLLELNKLESKRTKLKSLQEKRFILNGKYEKLIQQIEKKHPNYHQLKYNDKPADLKTIQSILSKQKTIVSYFLGNDFIYTFSITANKIAVLKIDKPKDFAKLIEAYKKSISQMNRKKFIEMGQSLYQILLKDVLEDKRLKNINSIQIIPDGILAEIPFETLITEQVQDNTTYAVLPYLINKYKVSYYYSATLLQWTIQQKNKTKNNQLENSYIGFAPVYRNEKTNKQLLQACRSIRIGGKDFQELLHSETEISSIQKQFQKKK